jgi:hypothetical protein
MQTRSILVTAPVWASQARQVSCSRLARERIKTQWLLQELSARLAAQAHPKLK